MTHLSPQWRELLRASRLPPEEAEQCSAHLQLLLAQAEVPAATARPRYLLVGCGAKKRLRASAARDLYTGPLFQAARTYAESTGLPWRVLSAAYGVVDPGDVIAPYDRRLPQSADGWAMLAAMVADQLHRLGWAGGVVEVHAGAAYADLVAAASAVRGLDLLVERPLRGLEVGRRLHWYATQRGQS